MAWTKFCMHGDSLMSSTNSVPWSVFISVIIQLLILQVRHRPIMICLKNIFIQCWTGESIYPLLLLKAGSWIMLSQMKILIKRSKQQKKVYKSYNPFFYFDFAIIMIKLVGVIRKISLLLLFSFAKVWEIWSDHLRKKKNGLRKVENIFYIHANNYLYEIDIDHCNFRFLIFTVCPG